MTKKYNKRNWNNKNSKGYLFNVDLIDGFGSQINATFFNLAVDKFEPIIQENHVYIFTNGEVKIANRRYTAIQNDFCIVFDKQAEIYEVEDDETIQS